MITSGRPAGQRTCDECGNLRPMSRGRMIEGLWICDYHDGWIGDLQAERVPIRTFKIRPLKDPRPFAPRSTYETDEIQILNFINEYMSVGLRLYDWNGSSPPPTIPDPLFNDVGIDVIRGLAWSCIYLHGLIVENKRPPRFITLARVTLKRAADALVAYQTYDPANTGVFEYGSFRPSDPNGIVSGVFRSSDSAMGGLGLLRAYQVLGTTSYLDRARAAAWFCRTAQCGDMMNTGFASADAGGLSRKHHGALWSRAFFDGLDFTADHYYTGETLATLEFWKAFKDQVGDEIIGSTETGAAAFHITSRAAALSVAMAELRDFWANGTYDNVRTRTFTGLSTTDPYEGFDSFPSAGKYVYGLITGNNSWKNLVGGDTVDAVPFAAGLRGLRAYEGDSTQVLTIFDWLMTFTADSAFAFGTRRSADFRAEYPYGDFDTKFAAPSRINAVSKKNGAPLYDLAATGLLAPLFSSRQAERFRDLKAELGEPRRWFRRAEARPNLYVGPMGICGLSMQPYSSWTSTTVNQRMSFVWRAAMTGLIYREAPQAFMMRGH